MLDEEIRQEYAWNPSHFLPNHQTILANPITDILARSIRGKKTVVRMGIFIRLATRIMQIQIMKDV